MSKKTKRGAVSFETEHFRTIRFDGRILTIEDSFDPDDFCKAILEPEDRRTLGHALLASLPDTKENQA